MYGGGSGDQGGMGACTESCAQIVRCGGDCGWGGTTEHTEHTEEEAEGKRWDGYAEVTEGAEDAEKRRRGDLGGTTRRAAAQ